MKLKSQHFSWLLGGVLLAGTALPTLLRVGSGGAASAAHTLTGATAASNLSKIQGVRLSPEAGPAAAAASYANAQMVCNQRSESPSLESVHSANIDKIQRLAALGEQSVPSLTAQLVKSQTADEKTILSDALVRIGSTVAMQAFSSAVLLEANDQTRVMMLRSLDATSTPAALEMTTSLIGVTSDPAVLAAVDRTISRMGNAETVEFLGELYSEAENVPGQHQSALLLLAAVRNPDAVPAQAALLNQAASDEVCLASASSLARIGTQEAIQGLVEAFEKLPPERSAIRQEIIQHLSDVSNPQSTAYLQFLSMQSREPLIKEAARAALATMPMTASADTPPVIWPRP